VGTPTQLCNTYDTCHLQADASSAVRGPIHSMVRPQLTGTHGGAVSHSLPLKMQPSAPSSLLTVPHSPLACSRCCHTACLPFLASPGPGARHRTVVKHPLAHPAVCPATCPLTPSYSAKYGEPQGLSEPPTCVTSHRRQAKIRPTGRCGRQNPISSAVRTWVHCPMQNLIVCAS
jgi:hypothetical protein